MKIRIFDVEIGGVQRSIQNMDQLKAAISDIKKEQSSSDFGSKKYRQADSTLAALVATQKKAQQTTRDNVREKQAEDNTYRGLSARLNALRTRYKDLALSEKQGTKEARALRLEITGLDNKLKQVDADVGQFQRSVGNYANAFRGAGRSILSSFGVGSAASVLVAGIRNAASVVADFDQAQANLASVTGKTREEIQGLTDDAKRYGGTTAFTASQVSELQLELAKLGFTTQEIQDSTKSIIDFSVATGAEIPRAAKLAGASLRIFNLDAKEMERVVSVLGVSTTKSALDFGKLETAMSTVGPVANAFGFSIEETVALLGGLSNAGFDASKAAVATRNIILKLADSGGELAQELGGAVKSFDDLIPALIQLRDEGVNLNDTLDLTDARSVAAFNTFLDGAETVDELRDSITDVNDELEIMAEKQLDTVKGKVTLLNSAWQGLILSVEEGDGAFSDFAKGATEALTGLLTLVTDINEGTIDLSEAFGENPFNILGALKNIKGQLEDNRIADEVADSVADNVEKAAERIVTLRNSENEEDRKLSEQLLERLAERGVSGSENAQRIGTRVQQLITAQDEASALREKQQEEVKVAEAERKRLEDRKKALEAQATIRKKEREELAAIKKQQQEINAAIKEAEKLERGREDALSEELKLLEKIAQAEKFLADGAAELFDTSDGTVGLFEEQVLRDFEEGQIALQDLAKLLNEARLEQEKLHLENVLSLQDTSDQERIEALERLAEIEENLNADRVRAEKKTNDDRLRDQKKFFQEFEKLAASAQNDFPNAIIGIGNLISQGLADGTVTLTESLAKLEEELPQILTGIASSITSGIVDRELEASETLKENRIRDLEAEFDRKIELAEGDATRQKALRAQLTKLRQKEEREAFERTKQIKIKEAIINGFLAASQTIANLGFPAAIPALIAVGIASAIQVAGIKTQKFGEGGKLKDINKGHKAHVQKLAKHAPVPGYQMSDGGSIPIPGVARGKRHSSGGIKTILNGHPVEIEDGEFVDFDEDGNIVIINRTDTARSIKALNAMAGTSFSGKGKALSDINSKHGVAFARDGLNIARPNLTAPAGIGVSIGINMDELKKAVMEGAREGARIGAMEGTELGAETGAAKGAQAGAEAGTAKGMEMAELERSRQKRLEQNSQF